MAHRIRLGATALRLVPTARTARKGHRLQPVQAGEHVGAVGDARGWREPCGDPSRASLARSRVATRPVLSPDPTDFRSRDSPSAFAPLPRTPSDRPITSADQQFCCGSAPIRDRPSPARRRGTQSCRLGRAPILFGLGPARCHRMESRTKDGNPRWWCREVSYWDERPPEGDGAAWAPIIPAITFPKPCGGNRAFGPLREPERREKPTNPKVRWPFLNVYLPGCVAG